jgi:hypothetical protein
MTEILHNEMPEDLRSDAGLPGVRPLTDGRWLRRDEVYAGQMAYRRQLLAEQRDTVLWTQPGSEAAVAELFSTAEAAFPSLGIDKCENALLCPDGARIETRESCPLLVLGQVLQEDLCLLEKRGSEHVLTAAVLCFPASWTLAEKAGKPLTRIHKPVGEYDGQMARRVQRLFDGVQVGRPLWRNNMLRYADPDLHQPRSETDPARTQPSTATGAYCRAERQCILRLPRTQAVVFSIHTYVVRI